MGLHPPWDGLAGLLWTGEARWAVQPHAVARCHHYFEVGADLTILGL